jgi:nicotinate-nucleotide pyrophosphorylase (carboxylating)
MEIPQDVSDVIRRALAEDIGHGDVTTSLLIPEEKESKAHVIAKGTFIVAGLPFLKEVFRIIDPSVSLKYFFHDGNQVKRGDIIAEIAGKTRSLLSAERVSLNILQRLSGIATLTSQYVEKVKGFKAKVIDTRKTSPCLRFMEKYDVKMGGGGNHRFGLFDGILIKDNHIQAVGSVGEAMKRAKGGHHLTKIEVEVGNIHDLKDALAAGADIIMLDNMSIDDMKEAVAVVNGKVLLEASGNVTLERIGKIAGTGVDYISVGALTHSAPAADISLKIVF